MSDGAPAPPEVGTGTRQQRGRAAYRARDWATAVRELRAARAEASRTHDDLTADDLFALADSAWWLGDVELSVEAGEAAYRRYLDGDQPGEAAMAALGVATNLLLRGEVSLGSGWMSRAVHLVQDRPDAVEHHYLRYLTDVEGRLDEAATLPDAEYAELVAAAREVESAGRRLGDANLVAVGLVAAGRSRLKRGDCAGAMQLLDEAMVCVLRDDLAPEWAGNVYCHLMSACHEVGDLARAKEWTAATEHWLDSVGDAVLFRGICRVHRSQVLQTLGAWDRAEAEAQGVCADLAAVAPAVAAEGHYLLGELRRLRGDLPGARAAYERAHAAGRDPQPGLALLRLAQGRVDAALPEIRAAVLACADNRLACVPLWSAQVRIAVAAGERDDAERACQALQEAARRYRTAVFECEALAARGALELARGRAEAALPVLRAACRRWREVGADHQAAGVCLLLADAYSLLGAGDAANLERAAAHAVLDRLGAAPPPGATRHATPDGLTDREVEVLAAVAAGGSNRDVARSLTISEKTVARHLSNIFTKIGVGSRTEAAAYAFRHGLDGSNHPRGHGAGA